MDLKDLEKIHKESAAETLEFYEKFISLYKEIFEKSNKRMALVNFVHLPLNGLLNMIEQDKTNLMCEIFPELPDMFIRFMLPFLKLRETWGKIPNEEWVKEYAKLHSSQFDDWFPTKEHRENFNKWFEGEMKADKD